MRSDGDLLTTNRQSAFCEAAIEPNQIMLCWRSDATRKRSVCAPMAMLETFGAQFPIWLHCRRPLVQSIWGQNGLNPPQIATKIKLAQCCREFCEDFRKQKFIKINRVEHFQIAQFLCEPWGKILKKNRIRHFLSIWANTCIFQISMVYVCH